MLSTISKKKSNVTDRIRVVVIFGPTAVGKTELLFRRFSRGCEVVSADSLQVYRGLDIGTAKPSPYQQSLLPHHCIDIREPYEQFTVGDFVRLADRLCNEITSRGNIPLISGGTAYYLKHFLYGLPGAPPGDAEVRSRLQEELRLNGLASLYRELELLDPESASRIAPADAYRITRALEVCRCSGRPLSSFRVPECVRDRLDPVVIGLTREPKELRRRIAQRVKMMMDQGLVREMQQLMRSGATSAWPAMKGIGYREFFLSRHSGEYSLRDTEQQVRAHTVRYAKQQMTFFRSISRTVWIHPDDDRSLSKLCGIL